MYASANQRRKIQALGYKKGVPDILVFVPRGRYHGLCIEVKSAKGRITREQNRWHDNLERNGYFVMIPRSIEQAKELIEQYMQLH